MEFVRFFEVKICEEFNELLLFNFFACHKDFDFDNFGFCLVIFFGLVDIFF